jgi:aquaporin Z
VPLSRRLGAEFIGTFWLVMAGCGSAVLAARPSGRDIGPLGVAIAFGLALLTMSYAFGRVSGAHFNPAVTIGMWLCGRVPARDVLPYVLTQVGAAIAGTAAVYVIASGRPGYHARPDGLAANGFGAHSPGGYGLGAAVLTEVLMTSGLLLVILRVTDRHPPRASGPGVVGLALTSVLLLGIPVTNGSVNPARSTGPAVFVGGWALSQLWLFWLAPLAGAAIAGVGYRFVGGNGTGPRTPAKPPDPRPPVHERHAPGHTRWPTAPHPRAAEPGEP